MNQHDLIVQLSSQNLQGSDRNRLLGHFCNDMGWKPSDTFDAPDLSGLATVHLIVEHGLENTAVLTFLRLGKKFQELSNEDRNRILSISYNNLVDWHISIEPTEVSFVYNRIRGSQQTIETQSLSRDDVDILRIEAFEKIIGKRPNPNIPALDEALIKTISYWKRALSAELDNKVSNEQLSTLFNTVIFIRAIEDHDKRFGKSQRQQLGGRLLSQPRQSFTRIVSLEIDGIIAGSKKNLPFDPALLADFDKVDRSVMIALVNDFYQNRFTPYSYDFCIMSKHALSRIYEHYVSVLRTKDSPQLSLFSEVPDEVKQKALGSYYTPEFITRFFGKYLKEQLPPKIFRTIRLLDPACGSGIFLRSILEQECDTTSTQLSSDLIGKAFENVAGVDVDPNACNAAKLSLSLLHLVLTGKLPNKLNISTGEAIRHFAGTTDRTQLYDAIATNPPYISFSSQTEEFRDQITDYLGPLSQGRPDVYLAFVKLTMDLLLPGGFGLLVLPHSFLIATSAKALRKHLSETCWVRCLVDLSDISVFEDVGAYVILLIFQKKSDQTSRPPNAVVVKCRDYLGHALQFAIEEKEVEAAAYNVYKVEQRSFAGGDWILTPSTHAALQRKIESRCKPLSAFFEIRQGMNTGQDDVFIVEKERVPKDEERIFAPFLPDRLMVPYKVPETVQYYVFYPYLGNDKVTEAILSKSFPRTWKYLNSKRDILSNRLTVRKGEHEWWLPNRPRLPENMLRPKIVSPHLVLVPRFALDLEGKFAVSRSPLLFPKQEIISTDHLFLFAAVLNSEVSHWQIALQSHKYSRSYSMLEPKTLRMLPVPDFTSASPQLVKKIIELTHKRLSSGEDLAPLLEPEIDGLVLELFGVSTKEAERLMR